MTNLRRLDLNLLVTLDVLLSEHNVTRAAERLHYSQPSVSVHLARLREIFFAAPTTLGKALPLVRQGSGAGFVAHPENARLQIGQVTVFTLHLVGSRNNFNRPELVGRDAANRAWLKESIAAAKAAGSRAVLIVMQANAFPDRIGGLGVSPQFYDELWDAIRAFPGKVALVEEGRLGPDAPLLAAPREAGGQEVRLGPDQGRELAADPDTEEPRPPGERSVDEEEGRPDAADGGRTEDRPAEGHDEGEERHGRGDRARHGTAPRRERTRPR